MCMKYTGLRYSVYRLHFSGQIVENGLEKAEFDLAAGHVTVHLPKANPKEHFLNLDMLSLLMIRPGLENSRRKPIIEVLSQDSPLSAEQVASLKEESFSWEFPQTQPQVYWGRRRCFFF